MCHASRILILCFFLAPIGCTTLSTSKPLYDATRDLVSDPRVVGTWHWPGGGDVRIVSESSGSYRLTPITTPSPSTQPAEDGIRLELVRIGSYEYFFLPASKDQLGTELFCSRVEFNRSQMYLRMLNVQGVVEFLQQNPGFLGFRAEPAIREIPPRLPNTPGPVRMVLTDDPKRIRGFIVEHEDDPGFVGDAIVLERSVPRRP